MNIHHFKKDLAAQAFDLGFEAFGVATAGPSDFAHYLDGWLSAGKAGEMHWLARNADKRKDPRLILPEARSVIVLGINYNPQSRDSTLNTSIVPQASIARYARGLDYHDVIGDKLKTLCEWMKAQSPEPVHTRCYVDTGPVLEREWAQRAGIGWFGKSTVLISREYGTWLFLSVILTSMELPPDEPAKDHCGKCSCCIDICPTRAITAPHEVDARRCISYLTIELKGSIPENLRPLIGGHIYGCDDCLAICPWNRFARKARDVAYHSREGMDQPDLVKLLWLSEDEFRNQFRGSPIKRIKRRGLLRNVCVALGNIGDENCLPALENAAHDPEPLIAEHARWAIRQIQRRLTPNERHAPASP